jgi:glycosyltransferase involved in cell wall biosynthesis
MIENQDIICFSNDWDGDPLSKKHIMLRLARRNRILWVNSIGNRNPAASVHDLKRISRKLRQFASGCRRVEENIFVLSPLAIPFHGSAVARWVNRAVLVSHIRVMTARLGFSRPITWSFLPSSADVVGNLGEELIVYHCVDEFSEFSGTHKEAILELERRLMQKADVQIVSSSLLYETKRRSNPNTFLIHHGVDVQHFRRACQPDTPVPPDIAQLPRPVVGFVGLLADWVDFRLIQQLAVARPHWSFVLVGKVDADVSALRGLANVHLAGRQAYRDLPGYCRGMDAGILPFVLNTLTLAANPLKLREYLAAGLPVVATAIPEAERLGGFVRTARDPQRFLELLDSTLASPPPRLQVSRSMDGESWDHKVEEMSQVVGCPDRRRQSAAAPALYEPSLPSNFQPHEER